MAYAHRNADAYEALGYPETRLCLDPDHAGPNPLPIEKFSTKTRHWTDGRTVRYPASRCKECLSRRRRARRARRVKEDREAVRREERRNFLRHYNKDPEAYREYHRFWAEKQRRAAGVPQRTFKTRNGTDARPDKNLKVTQEFVDWLKLQNIAQVEINLDLPTTTLQKYAKGVRVKIKLGLADRVIMHVNDGTTLTDFWPDV